MSGKRDKRLQTLRFIWLHLRNWRNFTGADLNLPLRVFVVGPNASGKSNLLDVFLFLKDVASEGKGLQEAVRRRGGIKAIRALGARRKSEIEVTVRVGKPDAKSREDFLWEYTLVFNQDNRRKAVIRKERVVRRDPETGEISTLLDRPDEYDREDPERLYQTHLEQVTMNREFRDLVRFFESVKYLHVVPQIIRNSDRYAGGADDPYGGDFLEKLARTNTKTRRARLKRILEALKIAVPNLERLELFKDKTGVPHLRGKYRHWRARGAWQTEEQFSDGTLRLIGLLWSILEERGPLLLEEPELSLHPAVVRSIPYMFAQVQRRTKRQIIVSTHSFDMLRDEGIGPGEVVLLLPHKDGTQVTVMRNIEEARYLLESGMDVGELALQFTTPEKIEKLAEFGK